MARFPRLVANAKKVGKIKTMEKENQENWEKEFDEQFQILGDEQYPLRAIPQKLKMEVKKFIHQVLEKEREKWMIEKGKEKRNQLLNIVAFCALMEDNDGITGKSPDYILEKFNRYCLNENFEAYKWGLDSIKQKIVKNWAKRWLCLEIDF